MVYDFLGMGMMKMRIGGSICKTLQNLLEKSASVRGSPRQTQKVLNQTSNILNLQCFIVKLHILYINLGINIER